MSAVSSPSNLLSWTLREVARLERGGLRPPRITEPDHLRWHRVRRKLGWVPFVELLHEDLADAFPTSFALDRWSASPTLGLNDDVASELVFQAAAADDTDRPHPTMASRSSGRSSARGIVAMAIAGSIRIASTLPASSRPRRSTRPFRRNG